MMSIEASDLAVLITSTWRGGPSTHIWEAELVELSRPVANVAYQKLRRTAKNAPSIAEFLDIYNGLGGSAEVVFCADCGSQGWVDCTGDARHSRYCDRNPETCCCKAARPCTKCPAGERALVQQAGIDRRRAERFPELVAATSGPPAELIPPHTDRDF